MSPVRQSDAPATRAQKRLKREAGLSYVEVMIVVGIVAVALAPAIEGLQSGLASTDHYSAAVVAHHHLASQLETVLAEAYVNLEAAATTAGNRTTPSGYSDSPGQIDRRLVFLSRYDADNEDGDDDAFTGTDDGLLWVRVEFEASGDGLEALTSP